MCRLTWHFTVFCAPAGVVLAVSEEVVNAGAHSRWLFKGTPCPASGMISTVTSGMSDVARFSTVRGSKRRVCSPRMSRLGAVMRRIAAERRRMGWASRGLSCVRQSGVRVAR